MMFGDRPQGGDGAGVRNPSMGRRRLFRGAPAAPGVNTGDVGRPADPGQEARMENFRRMLGLGRRDEKRGGEGGKRQQFAHSIRLLSTARC
jgi:hypothetical protein